eukprot:5226460-Prymnesium_polylepis.1
MLPFSSFLYPSCPPSAGPTSPLAHKLTLSFWPAVRRCRAACARASAPLAARTPWGQRARRHSCAPTCERWIARQGCTCTCCSQDTRRTCTARSAAARPHFR